MKRLKSILTPGGVIGALLLLFWIFFALAGTTVAPFGISEMDLSRQMAPPGGGHILGTDDLGRDLFSRIIIGSRTVLGIGVMTALFSTFVGTLIGFTAGYFGGLIDEMIMRIMDILLSVPALVLAMVIIGLSAGSNVFSLTLIISIVFTPRTARVARSALLEWRDREFVDAARIRGESNLYILYREILPNTLGTILVEATARIAYSIMTVAALGFLGIGLQPPAPDWGMMISENRKMMVRAPWTVLWPAVAIASLVIGAALFSDFLKKRLLDE